MKRPLVSLVVPVYKEEGSIPAFLERTRAVLRRLPADYEILFCLDPSPDRSEAVIRAAIARDRRVRLMVFSRRFGQPPATLAGLRAAKGDAVAVMDVDLQDPPELLEEMFKRWQAGVDVVAARRRSRTGEPWVKKWVSSVGYRLINAASEVSIPPDTGDFRLMSRRVVDQVAGLREKHGFLRGLVAFVGFRQEFVEFDRVVRAEGETKHNPYFGSLKIGFNGLVGFSNFLLNATLVAGLGIAGMGVLGTLFMVTARFGFGVQYPLGMPTAIILILLIGGAQLVAMGILGLYIGRIYDEVKDRPTAIVDRAYNLAGGRRG